MQKTSVGLLVIGLGIFLTPASVLAYGETAVNIINELSTNHINRASGSDKEAITGDYIESLFTSYGLTTTVQPFTYNRGGLTYNSQNIIAEKPGTSGLQIIVGAHYDTSPSTATIDRTQLQGTNDNASGVGLLMELAEAINSLNTTHTIKFIGFGAEEVGLRGSRFYANNMSQSEINNTLFMTNFDSIVFGDYMYFHAGVPAATLPGWGFARDLVLDIASDLGIDVYTNPGLNAEYPAGTGCCSDHVSFENLMPILVGEATNWLIGDLDGYTQTSSPLVPGGATWHDQQYDSLEFIKGNFLGWIEERTSKYSQIMQALLVEANSLNDPVQSVPENNMVWGIALATAFLLCQRKKPANLGK